MMRKKTRLWNYSSLLIAAALITAYSHCDKATGNLTPDPQSAVNIPPPQGNFFCDAQEMLTTKDSIVIFSNTCDCVHDSLHPAIIRKAYHYVLVDSFLTFTLLGKCSGVCTTSFFAGFSRLSGSGLAGNWLFNSVWTTFSGTPAKADSMTADSGKKAQIGVRYKWMTIDSVKNTIKIYTDPDTTTFTTDFKRNYQPLLNIQHIAVDSAQPNIVQLTGTSNDSLVIINYYRLGITLYRTSDTTRYSPDPYIFNAGSMCPAKMFPPWIQEYINDNNPFPVK
jgi:hypothetical protein